MQTRWLLFLLLASPAMAHVPYVEESDYTAAKPFVVEDVDQSKALYGWLGTRGDVDFYSMQVTGPIRIYTHTLVPMCAETRAFNVTYALVGPGLPIPASSLPFDLPPGDGAILVRDAQPAAGGARPTMHENFSNRDYFQGPEFEYEAKVPGEYRMVVWSETGSTGDYVAVIGRAEKFGATDMWQVAKETLTIRRANELHGACTQVPGGV